MTEFFIPTKDGWVKQKREITLFAMIESGYDQDHTSLHNVTRNGVPVLVGVTYDEGIGYVSKEMRPGDTYQEISRMAI